MISDVFLRVSLLGAEWVLYLLVLLSIFSVALILERVRFYRQATSGLAEYRTKVRDAIRGGDWQGAAKLAQARLQGNPAGPRDFDAEMVAVLVEHRKANPAATSPDVLSEVAADSLTRTRVQWERNLAVLATVGNNAPFVGLFGTVLGIIQAFHDLSQQAQAGVTSAVTAGLSEALIATAFGILVAIPAVAAFNLFQRKVRASLAEAESLKSFVIGRISADGHGRVSAGKES